MSEEMRDFHIDVNIKGVLNGIAAVLPEFEAQKSGHVIATSSVAGLKVYPGASVYCGTKWAVRAIMEGLRMESAQAGTNIRTATIYPAAVQSELVSHITDEGASKSYRELYDNYEIPAERICRILEAKGLSWDEIDRFDQLQLAAVAAECRRHKSLAAAGRALYQASRRQRTAPNDSDRLRKYLRRFGLEWADVAE